ncbi:MAG: twin-arginine translocase TatA/TatE family subunit [Gemmataceae bacterium]|nr:twin-arginine translocase TatA/TatE family subunit [Gemmataceae bacterium]
MAPLFGFFPSLGMTEMLVLLVIGVLLFGRKLPEVGRYLGKGIVEFKKGIRGIEDDVDISSTSSQAPAQAEAAKPPQKIASTAPKFEDIPASSESTPKAAPPWG